MLARGDAISKATIMKPLQKSLCPFNAPFPIFHSWRKFFQPSIGLDGVAGKKSVVSRRIIGLGVLALITGMAVPAVANVSAFTSVFTAPPMPLPRYQQLDAPLLGNGDMAVAISGGPEAQQFWLGKNDFWELRNVWCRSGPRPFGHLDILIPQLQGATYYAEQNLLEATTGSSFKKNQTEVTMRSWVSATENLLVVELSVKGEPVEGEVQLWIPPEPRATPQIDHRPKPGMAPDWTGISPAPISESKDGIFWGVRSFLKDVEIPTAAACAFRLLGGDKQHFRLAQDHPVILVAAMRSLRQGKQFVAVARKQVASLDQNRLAALYADHMKWWRNFWDKSSVHLGDAELEWRYHVSNYILASCSRDPDYPPGIAGPWVTTDQPMWTGAYTMNYNHEACFYGLYSANHIEQADPEDAPVLDFRKRGEYYAREVLNCRGVLYPVKFGPVGIETTRDEQHPNIATRPDDPPWLRQKGGLFLGQRSNAAFAAVNMAQRWYMTYDPTYARKVYPFIRDVALFWEDYLKFEPTPAELIKATENLPKELRQPADGRYVIYKDGANEGGQDTNPVISLGLVRNVLKLALDMSHELGVDEKERDKWNHILSHLSAITVEEKNGTTVFHRMPLAYIYPAGGIGLGSDPQVLAIARNMIKRATQWVSFNGSSSFFPATARVGYDGDVILEKLHELNFHPNGIIHNEGHMIENCSVVPNTVNEMLLQSHEGILRLFPVWPKNRDAQFHTLRAYGAFLVSAAIEDSLVKDVVIVSEKGRSCLVQNPWPGTRVQLIVNGKPIKTLDGERLSFNTSPGDRIELLPEPPKKPGSP